jgi:hypothetical protein
MQTQIVIGFMMYAVEMGSGAVTNKDSCFYSVSVTKVCTKFLFNFFLRKFFNPLNTTSLSKQEYALYSDLKKKNFSVALIYIYIY